MITKFARIGLKIGALAAVLAVAAPALAQNHGGGGHFGGGGGAHMSGGHGFSGGHGAVGHAYGGFHGGVHGYTGTSHFAPGAHYGYGGGYGYGHGGWGGGWHGGWGGGWRGGYWGGGYWHGGFWPRAYYGLGFSWFLPVLPLAYATYWWDGIPYYYANNVYYTWNPSYDGYTVTDPPPVGDANAPASDDGSAAAPAQMPPPSAGAPVDQIFMYPKNGQTEQQTATDRGECQQWAASQAGGAGRPDDYRRAMSACAEARGYSVR